MTDPTGSPPAPFDELFREWFPRLVALGISMTGQRDVARDVAQESLLRAHQRWDQVGAYDHPGAWVRKVAVNLLIDHQRATRSERTAVERLSQPADLQSPAPALDRWHELVDGLPPRQLAIVTLYYADDVAVDQIAEILDVAVGTVKAQLHKARARLRDRLADDADRDSPDSGGAS